MNIDETLHRAPDRIVWADRFEALTDRWLDNQSGNNEESIGDSMESYARILEHLNLEERSRLDEWKSLQEEAAMRPSRANEEEDDSWRDMTDSPSRQPSSIHAEFGAGQEKVDALFSGLSNRPIATD